MNKQIYIPRVILNKEGECDFSQIDSGLEVRLYPYLKLTKSALQIPNLI